MDITVGEVVEVIIEIITVSLIIGVLSFVAVGNNLIPILQRFF